MAGLALAPRDFSRDFRQQAAGLAQVVLVGNGAPAKSHAGHAGGRRLDGGKQAVTLGVQLGVGQVRVKAHARNFGGAGAKEPCEIFLKRFAKLQAQDSDSV